MTFFTESVALSNGVTMPRLGLGVYQMPAGATTQRAVTFALQCGYRHIDTAAIYGNESDVGHALRDSGVPRSEVFITTKLWSDDQGFDSALRAFEQSMKRLRLDVLDLYLVHWPVLRLRRESWRALERLYTEGRVRAIGVSNFMTWHLDELAFFAQIMPMVNQIEVHPFLQQRDVRAYCHARQIVVQAYSPLVRARRFDEPVLVKIAAKHHCSPAQVLVRWALEQGLVVLPKSVTPARIQENANVTEIVLDADDHHELLHLEEGLATGWDPRQQR